MALMSLVPTEFMSKVVDKLCKYMNKRYNLVEDVCKGKEVHMSPYSWAKKGQFNTNEVLDYILVDHELVEKCFKREYLE